MMDWHARTVSQKRLHSLTPIYGASSWNMAPLSSSPPSRHLFNKISLLTPSYLTNTITSTSTMLFTLCTLRNLTSVIANARKHFTRHQNTAMALGSGRHLLALTLH